MSTPKHIAILLAGFSFAAQVNAAGTEATPKKAIPAKVAQPNIQFLEYLGTVEGDDENWTDVDTGIENDESVSASKANAKVEAAKPVVERK